MGPKHRIGWCGFRINWGDGKWTSYATGRGFSIDIHVVGANVSDFPYGGYRYVSGLRLIHTRQPDAPLVFKLIRCLRESNIRDT